MEGRVGAQSSQREDRWENEKSHAAAGARVLGGKGEG